MDKNNLIWKGMVFGIVVLFVGAGVVPSIGGINSSLNDVKDADDYIVSGKLNVGGSRGIIYVNWDGSADYTTIQEGIDAASDYDTVFVYNGTYYENVVVNKTINFMGEDKSNTVIDGGETGDVVHISADWINISGFTIRNGGHIYWPDSGIHVCSNHNNISNNTIMNNARGIFLRDFSLNNNVHRNIITQNSNGLALGHSSKNNISENIIISNSNDGIHIQVSSENKIIRNTIVENSGDGVTLWQSLNNSIIENTIANNHFSGIGLSYFSNNNLLYHNNLINNTQNARDSCSNTWYNVTLHEGNYWDDFETNPGYPDVYEIPGGGNVDLYPLTEPFVSIPGDLDYDGDVDLNDLAQLLSNYGTPSGATYWMGDIDGDGDVDLSDLAALLANYGYGT